MQRDHEFNSSVWLRKLLHSTENRAVLQLSRGVSNKDICRQWPDHYTSDSLSMTLHVGTCRINAVVMAGQGLCSTRFPQKILRSNFGCEN